MTKHTHNPPLHEIPLQEALDAVALGFLRLLINDIKPSVVSYPIGHWNRMLARAYSEGIILLALDANDKPVKAFRRSITLPDTNPPTRRHNA